VTCGRRRGLPLGALREEKLRKGGVHVVTNGVDVLQSERGAVPHLPKLVRREGNHDATGAISPIPPPSLLSFNNNNVC
jgi:hypothetical protein